MKGVFASRIDFSAFQRLRLHAIVCRDDENGECRDISGTRAILWNAAWPGRINEGDMFFFPSFSRSTSYAATR